MDPSALIFVALAVAWAVYLIPKALEHHEEGARTRTVERFSKTMRVLARREPVNRKQARLVKGSAAKSASAPVPAAAPAAAAPPAAAPAAAAPATAQPRARRTAAARAAQRRLRVVTLILVLNAVVAGLAAFGVVGWVWCAAPLGVLVAWLVACRVMVKRERAAALPVRRRAPAAAQPAPAPSSTPAASVVTEADAVVEPAEETAETAPEPSDPESWDPVPVTLPTYVSKPVAPRSVRTIDLDSTGVWSSGRNESDSALAREAEAADRAAKDADAASEERRSS